MVKRALGAAALALVLSSCGSADRSAVVEFADASDVRDATGQACPGEETGGTMHDYPQGAHDMPGAATTAREAVTRYVEKVRDQRNMREFRGARFVQRGTGKRVTFEAINDAGEVRGAVHVERDGETGSWLVTTDWTCQGFATAPPLVTRGMNTATPKPAADPDTLFSGPGS